MTWMTAADFEARYRANPDPWGYTQRRYERDKYAATLDACGPGPFTCALELGSSIGVFSALLAPRCEHLVTVDASPTAVASARVRLRDHPQVQVVLGTIPAAIPDRRLDLVVASEILYYLSPPALQRTLAVVVERMGAGARLVAVHWRAPGAERPFDADGAHAALRARPELVSAGPAGTEDYLLEAMTRR